MGPPRRTLVFIINSLAGGGAERVLINLIGHLEDELADYDVHLVLLDDEPEQQTAPAWVTKHVLDANWSMVRSVRLLTSLLRRLAPDLTVSFLNRSNCANIIAARMIGFPCLISERVHTSSHFPKTLSGAVNRLVVRLTYPFATGTLAVSDGIRQDLAGNFGVPFERIRVIHNPIDIDALGLRAGEAPDIDLPPKFILGVGRLVPNKNFPMLIEAYANSGLDYPVVILGEGPERDALEAQIADLGLQDRVRLPGFVKNPYPIMKRAHFLVSASNAEGFPNSLIEAMTLGCPVVATDCESGPREILDAGADRQDGAVQAPYGILTPTNNAAALTEAVRLMDDADIRARYAEAGRRRAKDYSVESSVQAYLDAIRETLPGD